MTQSLGEYIAKRRHELRMTQTALADRLAELGVPRTSTTIANWESDRAPVPLELFEVLAQALQEPSAVVLYDLAGILDKIPGGNILRLLHDVPTEDVERIERLVQAYFDENNS